MLEIINSSIILIIIINHNWLLSQCQSSIRDSVALDSDEQITIWWGAERVIRTPAEMISTSFLTSPRPNICWHVTMMGWWHGIASPLLSASDPIVAWPWAEQWGHYQQTSELHILFPNLGSRQQTGPAGCQVLLMGAMSRSQYADNCFVLGWRFFRLGRYVQFLDQKLTSIPPGARPAFKHEVNMLPHQEGGYLHHINHIPIAARLLLMYHQWWLHTQFKLTTTNNIQIFSMALSLSVCLITTPSSCLDFFPLSKGRFGFKISGDLSRKSVGRVV